MRTRLASLAAAALLAACAGAKPPSAADWMSGTYELECDRVGQEGQQIVKVWTTARTVDLALRDARRNAVRGLVLRGLATSACQVPAMLPPADLTPEKSAYLQEFFKDGGQYEGYVTRAGDEAMDKLTVAGGVKVASLLVVARGRLQADLERAGIVKGFAAGLK